MLSSLDHGRKMNALLAGRSLSGSPREIRELSEHDRMCLDGHIVMLKMRSEGAGKVEKSADIYCGACAEVSLKQFFKGCQAGRSAPGIMFRGQTCRC